jgi:hypothetical protein
MGGRGEGMGGGRGEGLDWCMVKAGVWYTRIPDPAHVLSARGCAEGVERKTDNHRIRGPKKALLKMSNRVLLSSYLVANTVGPSIKNVNKRFVHSFIHSFCVFLSASED